MNRDYLRNDYFNWLQRLVVDGPGYFPRKSYKRLFRHLFETQFIFLLDMDENRAGDGINLRYSYGREYDIPQPAIASLLDDRPCSVLEMMIALATRCENQVMSNPDIGNRAGLWFWNMLKSLGLHNMSDDRYDASEVNYILDRFLMRKYDDDGQGGLYTIKNVVRSMREIEIWYQMMQYLNEAIERKEISV